MHTTQPTIYGYGRNVQFLAFSVAQNVHGRNVHGRNVRLKHPRQKSPRPKCPTFIRGISMTMDNCTKALKLIYSFMVSVEKN